MRRKHKGNQTVAIAEIKDQNSYMLKFYLISIISDYWFYYEFICEEKLRFMHELKTNLVCPLSFNKANEGKPVCISGSLDSKSKTPLKDDEFQITVLGLSLKRHVEMLQYSIDTKSLP